MENYLEIADDANDLYVRLADYWEQVARQAIDEHGGFYVALAGGSTPKNFYNLLTTSPYKEQFPWNQTYVYFGDERCVEKSHSDSNYAMAYEAMLKHLPIPASQIHPMEYFASDIPKSAETYRTTLLSTVPKSVLGIPQFDLVLLGLGDDGHTASLFPGTDILQESEKLVATVWVEKFNTHRISLTYPTINESRHVAFLVAGKGKAEIIGQLFGSGDSEIVFPAQRIRAQQELIWFLDRDAASTLPPEISAL